MKILKSLYHSIVPKRIRKEIKNHRPGFEMKLKSNKKFINIWNPDSIKNAGYYPEVSELWKKWIYNNAYNNGGDFTRFFSFVINISNVLHQNVEGSFAELGVYKGNSAAILSYYASKDNRKLFLFDTFEGFDAADIKGIDSGRKEGYFSDTSIELVKRNVGTNNNIRYIKGYFPDSITEESKEEKYSFVSLDCDLYKPILEGLNFFYPRLSGGGCHFLPRLFVGVLGWL